MTNQYHATPYDLSAIGFYFHTFEEYTAQAAKHRNAHGEPVEEYEIQFIEGDNYKLFDALGINQANLKRWFDQFEDLDEDDLIKSIYLADDQGCNMDQVLSQLEDVVLFEGSAEDYAENYIEETGLLDQMHESLRYYFDTKAFARDMLLNGDITELTIEGTTYIALGC